VVITEIETTGFKWQSPSKGPPTGANDASWTARGVPAGPGREGKR
jgi:hypothetical protein